MAVRVDEWIARPLVRDRFLAMLRAWRAEHDGHGKHGDGLLPVRAMTQPEKYAALAAIHDRVCEGAEQLDLWDCRRGHGDVQKMKAGMAYVYLQDCVNVLSTEDQARVEGVVSDIEADLAKVTAESAQTPIGELVEFCRSVGKRLNKIGFGPDLSDIDRYHAARDVMDEALVLICRADAAYSKRPDSALVYEKVQRVREALSELTKITAEPYDEAERNTEAAKTNRWMRAANEFHRVWQELDSLRDVPCGDQKQAHVAQTVTSVSIEVGTINVAAGPLGPADQEQEPEKRTNRRGKQGVEKWRRAQQKMLVRLKHGTLPKTLRDAAKAIDETYGTTRRAARKSAILAAHFGVQVDGDAAGTAGGSLLEELATQADKRTRERIEQMPERDRAEIEAQLREMPRDDWPKLVQVLATNPEAGGAGDVPLIEDADQDSRLDDPDG